MRRPARDRIVVAAILTALVVGVPCWFQGASLWLAVAVALMAAAVVAGALAMPRAERPVWPPHRLASGPGMRDDVRVAGLSVSTLNGRVQPRLLEQLRAVAQGRLAQRGLDLDAASDRDRITALIGASAFAMLNSRVTDMPGPAELLETLRTVDALDDIPARRSTG